MRDGLNVFRPGRRFRFIFGRGILSATVKLIKGLLLSRDLPCRSLPKGVDIAQTLAGELVVSERFETVWQNAGLVGMTFGPIFSPSPGVQCERFKAPIVSGGAVRITDRTEIGNNPLTSVGKSEPPCPLGDTLGFAVLSELFIESPLGIQDAYLTRQFIGVRRGALRPTRLLVLSARAFKALCNAKIVGATFEIAHTKG